MERDFHNKILSARKESLESVIFTSLTWIFKVKLPQETDAALVVLNPCPFIAPSGLWPVSGGGGGVSLMLERAAKELTVYYVC